MSSDSSSYAFLNTVLDLCLVQHVLKPTHGNHILDLAFFQQPETVSNVHILEPLMTSDLQMIMCEFNLDCVAAHEVPEMVFVNLMVYFQRE